MNSSLQRKLKTRCDVFRQDCGKKRDTYIFVAFLNINLSVTLTNTTIISRIKKKEKIPDLDYIYPRHRRSHALLNTNKCSAHTRTLRAKNSWPNTLPVYILCRKRKNTGNRARFQKFRAWALGITIDPSRAQVQGRAGRIYICPFGACCCCCLDVLFWNYATLTRVFVVIKYSRRGEAADARIFPYFIRKSPKCWAVFVIYPFDWRSINVGKRCFKKYSFLNWTRQLLNIFTFRNNYSIESCCARSAFIQNSKCE